MPKKEIKKTTNPRPQKSEKGKGTITRTTTRRYRADVETGLLTDAYISSIDPSTKSEYYFRRKLLIGAKNAKREIGITFQSLEIEENAELLHLLHDKTRS